MIDFLESIGILAICVIALAYFEVSFVVWREWRNR